MNFIVLSKDAEALLEELCQVNQAKGLDEACNTLLKKQYESPNETKKMELWSLIEELKEAGCITAKRLGGSGVHYYHLESIK